MFRQEIPRDEWSAFLDHFTRVHRGWRVRVETTRSAGRPRLLADDIELAGISCDPGLHRAGAIVIEVGETGEKHLTHWVARPRRILLEQDDEGADRALRIASERRETVVVRLRTPARIETLDGYP
jgi:hypothetical protein